MNEDGDPRRSHYAPFPGSVQTVPKSEMFALFMILSWIKEDATIWSDCKSVVEAFARGREHPSNRLSLHAQLWRGIFDRADPKRVRVRKVLAHSTEEHVRRGLVTPTQRKSNDSVDSCEHVGAVKHATDKQKRIAQRKLCDKVRKVAASRAKVVILTAVANRPSLVVRRAMRRKQGAEFRKAFSLDAQISKRIRSASAETRPQPCALDGGI